MHRGSTKSGTLFLVSTPIGNLGDITLRAIDTLKKVALILAEDTRHSRTLLRHFDVTARVESYHEHNETETTPRVIDVLSRGEDVALISDAGTPLLSDPGYRLVRAAIDAGIVVVPIPGASALLAAVAGSGLDTTNFTFLGFLARKGVERSRTLRYLSDLPHTAVLYEAPTRLSATLNDLVDAGCGDRDCVVARELTKQFEEFRRGTVGELAQYYADSPPKGEVVILLGGAPAKQGATEADLEMVARELRAQGISSREVAAVLQQAHGASRNVAYRLAHDRS